MARQIENALTLKGAALIAKALAGGFPVEFTRAALGTGVAEDAADIGAFTELMNYFADAEIVKRSVTADGVMTITLQFWNTDVAESTYIDEIGVYAKDPNEGEVLFSYLTFGQYPDLILAETNTAVQRTYDIPFVFGAGDHVSVQIVPSGLLPADDAVETATAGKLLRLNADAKLPASITGDAATLGGVAKDGYALVRHVHDAASAAADGFLSKADKAALETLKLRVNQGLTAEDVPTFKGLVLNGYIDGARFR